MTLNDFCDLVNNRITYRPGCQLIAMRFTRLAILRLSFLNLDIKVDQQCIGEVLARDLAGEDEISTIPQLWEFIQSCERDMCVKFFKIDDKRPADLDAANGLDMKQLIQKVSPFG